MDVVKFLLDEWDSILIVIAVFVAVIWFIKRGEASKLKSILFQLVTKAEQEYGQGTGELKYAVVVDWLYQRMPTILKFLFTPKDINKMVESVLKYAKEKWNTNETLNEYVLTNPVAVNTEHIEAAIQKIANEVIKKEQTEEKVEEISDSEDTEEAKG